MRIRSLTFVFMAACIGLNRQSMQCRAQVPLFARTETTVQELARLVDRLEKHVETYGSVVAKTPDIWGEERLTLHRFEYEQQLRKELEKLHGTINAQIRRSDQAFLASAMAVSAAAAPTTTTNNRATSLLNSSTTSTSLLPADNFVRPTTDSRSGFANAIVDPKDYTPGSSVALEPTLFLDQLSRYLNHLHELRRINEGDDIKDLPGYTCTWSVCQSRFFPAS
jgi:hypothetical protein